MPFIEDTATRCIYCDVTLSAENKTEDHVIGRAWFPAEQDIPKWKVLACLSCNNNYSKHERDILSRMAMCLDPKDPRTATIVHAAKRSMNAQEGKNDRDSAAREKRRQKMLSQTLDLHDPNAAGALPSFKDNFDKGSRTGIFIPGKALDAVVSKWARGILFCEKGIIVPAHYEVSPIYVTDEVAAEAFKEIVSHCTYLVRGWGIEVLYSHVVEGDVFGSLFAFNIWDRFRAYCSIGLPDKATQS